MGEWIEWVVRVDGPMGRWVDYSSDLGGIRAGPGSDVLCQEASYRIGTAQQCTTMHNNALVHLDRTVTAYAPAGDK